MDKSQYKGIRDIMCGLVFAFVGMDKGHKRILRSTITDAHIDQFLADIDQFRGVSYTQISPGAVIENLNIIAYTGVVRALVAVNKGNDYDEQEAELLRMEMLLKRKLSLTEEETE